MPVMVISEHTHADAPCCYVIMFEDFETGAAF